jgi:hypothetical protein
MEKHSAKVGRAVNKWNNLHDELGTIFADLVNANDHPVGLTAWHALRSDNTQRTMLRAVAKAVLPEDTRFIGDLCWVLGEADQLAGTRNNYIHAGFICFFDEGTMHLIPDHFRGNPNAEKLLGKDLPKDLDQLQFDLTMLEDFAIKLRGFRLVEDDHPQWPDRPTLLRNEKDKNRKCG